MSGVLSKKRRSAEFAGSGCLIQGLGLVCLIGFWLFGPLAGAIGVLLGIFLLLAGSAAASITVCDNCRNKVQKDSKLCPACGAVFDASALEPTPENRELIQAANTARARRAATDRAAGLIILGAILAAALVYSATTYIQNG